MGLDINGTQGMLYAKSLGVDFSRLAMIGRQGLYLSPAELEAILKGFGSFSDAGTVERIFNANGGYAEEFFRYLGSTAVDSFDRSDYEGSTQLHDMNLEIPERFKQRYSVVLDGGCLEHIFNFPVAIRNCMQMVEVGGHFLAITPANNFMGHGFYQFSPELYFSIFTAVNGYALVRVIAFEAKSQTAWFSVKNPASINSRVTLTNSNPVYLFVIAKRTEQITPLETMPQQRDYVSVWNQTSVADCGITPEHKQGIGKQNKLLALLRLARRYLKPLATKLLGLDRHQHMEQSEFNPNFFEPVIKPPVCLPGSNVEVKRV